MPEKKRERAERDRGREIERERERDGVMSSNLFSNLMLFCILRVYVLFSGQGERESSGLCFHKATRTISWLEEHFNTVSYLWV